MAGTGNFYFYIVNRFDSLIYECEFNRNTDKKVSLSKNQPLKELKF